MTAGTFRTLLGIRPSQSVTSCRTSPSPRAPSSRPSRATPSSGRRSPPSPCPEVSRRLAGLRSTGSRSYGACPSATAPSSRRSGTMPSRTPESPPWSSPPASSPSGRAPSGIITGSAPLAPSVSPATRTSSTTRSGVLLCTLVGLPRVYLCILVTAGTFLRQVHWAVRLRANQPHIRRASSPPQDRRALRLQVLCGTEDGRLRSRLRPRDHGQWQTAGTFT